MSLPELALEQQAKSWLNNSIKFWLTCFWADSYRSGTRRADVKVGRSHSVFVSTALTQRRHTRGDVCCRLDWKELKCYKMWAVAVNEIRSAFRPTLNVNHKAALIWARSCISSSSTARWSVMGVLFYFSWTCRPIKYSPVLLRVVQHQVNTVARTLGHCTFPIQWAKMMSHHWTSSLILLSDFICSSCVSPFIENNKGSAFWNSFAASRSPQSSNRWKKPTPDFLYPKLWHYADTLLLYRNQPTVMSLSLKEFPLVCFHSWDVSFLKSFPR